MPTRLGNVLRRYETETRDLFGLNPVVVLSYAGLVAKPQERAYLDDQRSSMDLAIRMTLIWAICALISVFALWDDGAWNVIVLAFYALILLSYRGAVRTATFYGGAITNIVTLSRWRLLEAFRLPIPGTSDAERTQFQDLTAWLQGLNKTLSYSDHDPSANEAES
jgi:hypothetical protein